jgi:hypothetical protein
MANRTTSPSIYITYTPTLPYYVRRLKHAREQHGRFFVRTERAWQAHGQAIDNMAPRETIVKLAEYAEAMEECRMSAWRKIDSIKANMLRLSRVS